MNDRELILSGVLLFVAAACSFLAEFATRMRRIFRIAGLSLASLELAVATICIGSIGIFDGLLSERGFATLMVSGVGAWMMIEYLSSDFASDSGLLRSQIRDERGSEASELVD